MGLKQKSVFAINAAIIFACICMGVLGYISASNGFSKALEMKAEGDAGALIEIINYRYPGDWKIEGGELFKGDTKFDGADKIIDELSTVTGGKVTIFKGDTRIVTNVKDAAGSRQVGTKASQAIIDAVLNKGENFLGTANVVAEEQTAMINEIADSSKSLAKLADEMQNAVSTFKL